MTKPVTPLEQRRAGLVLEVDHDLSTDYHMWVYLPTDPAPGYMWLDWLGRDDARHLSTRWLTVRCNNSACPAIALVRADIIELAAHSAFPIA